MEYHGNFGHTLGRIQHIALMSRIDICYTACIITTQIVASTLCDLQGIKICIQYLYSHHHKTIFYPSSSNDGSNFIILACSGNKVEEYTTHNCLELHPDVYHYRIINTSRSVSVIIHTLLGVGVF